MGITRLMLKMIALGLVAAAIVCTIIAYWDKLQELLGVKKVKLQDCMCVSDYDDFEEL